VINNTILCSLCQVKTEAQLRTSLTTKPYVHWPLGPTVTNESSGSILSEQTGQFYLLH